VVEESLALLPAAQKRSVAAILMYTSWNLWKERNRRVFLSKMLAAAPSSPADQGGS
jgi:hypothetical protein